eukprot:11887744-Alexandrium_andersonii.AAC.1
MGADASPEGLCDGTAGRQSLVPAGLGGGMPASRPRAGARQHGSAQLGPGATHVRAGATWRLP